MSDDSAGGVRTDLPSVPPTELSSQPQLCKTASFCCLYTARNLPMLHADRVNPQAQP